MSTNPTASVIGCYEAEAAVLGALLNLEAAFVTAGYVRQLEAEDFADPRNRVVLEAMRALVDDRAPVDPITVLGRLRRDGGERAMTDDRSAAVYLADLFQAAPTAGSLSYYLRIVLEHRVRRSAHELGIRLQQTAETASQEELGGLVQQAFADIARQAVRLQQHDQRRDEAVA